MHSVSRPVDEPAELAAIRESGNEIFGSLDAPLDFAFDGLCGYCERKPLWRSRLDGAGVDDTDLPDREGLLFTCDHFRPRRLFPKLIYEWNNLVYACQPCNSAKGGQWPSDADQADSYIHPCEDPDSPMAPDHVFEYDLDGGRLIAHRVADGTARANAVQTIRDLALNDPRGRIETAEYSAGERRISLADLRKRWVQNLRRTLDTLLEVAPHELGAVISGFVSPEARFSSIARQFVAESRYSRYLS